MTTRAMTAEEAAWVREHARAGGPPVVSTPLSVGEVCAGYGGLGMGLGMVVPTRVAWVADVEPGPRRLLAHRFPGVPNLGDVTTVDWGRVEPVDVLCGGTPCQDVSSVGLRAGMGPGTRSGLWEAMARAVEIIRPGAVVWENVAGVRSASAWSRSVSGHGGVGSGGGRVGDRPRLRALGRVVGDLAGLGYDAQWVSVRASDVGAPHRRERVFLLAAPADAEGVGLHWGWGPRVRGAGPADGGGRPVSRRLGAWAPAVARWEAVLGRPAPAPSEPAPGRGSGRRLSAVFAEWMMGLPEGWVTGVPGLSYTRQIRLLGNGVVPQQAAHALTVLASWSRQDPPDDDGHGTPSLLGLLEGVSA